MAPKAKPVKSAPKANKKKTANIERQRSMMLKTLGANRLSDIQYFHVGAACFVEQLNGAWSECELYGEEAGALLVRYKHGGCLEPLAGRRLCQQSPSTLPAATTKGDVVLVGAGGQAAGEWWPGVVLDEVPNGAECQVAYGKMGDAFIWTTEEGNDLTDVKVKVFYNNNGEVEERVATLVVRNAKTKSAKRHELRQGLHWLPIEGENVASLTASQSIFSQPLIPNTSYGGLACSIGAAWFASALPFCQSGTKQTLTPEELQTWAKAAGWEGKESFAAPEPLSCLALGDLAMNEPEGQQMALFRLMTLVSCGPPAPPNNGGIDAYLFDYLPMVAEILSSPAGKEAISSGKFDEIIAGLANVITDAIRKTPHLFVAASSAIQKAIAAAPEIMKVLQDLWSSASDAVIAALESDEAAKAYLVATQLASKAAALCKVAVERGASIAYQKINSLIDFLSDPNNLKSLADDGKEVMIEVFTEVQQFVSSVELEKFGNTLSKSFETLGNEGANIAKMVGFASGGGGGSSELEDAKKLLNSALGVAEQVGGRITESGVRQLKSALQKSKNLSSELASQCSTLIQEVVRSAPKQLVAALHKASAAAAKVDGGQIFVTVKSFLIEHLSTASNAAAYLGSLNVRLSIPVEELQQLSTTTVYKIMLQAKEKGASISKDTLDLLQSAAQTGSKLSENIMKNASKEIKKAIDALSDTDVADVQRALSAAGNACGGVYQQLSGVSDKAVEDAISAGRKLAPLAGKLVKPGVGHCTALAVGALAAARDAVDKNLPDEWRQCANSAAKEMQTLANGACATVGPAAASVANYVGNVDYIGGAAKIASGAAAIAESVGDVVIPIGEVVVSELAGLWDEADLDEAYTMSAQAVSGALGMLMSGAACACLQEFDMLNFDIIRDFYQMVSLFLSQVASESYKGVAKIWGYVGAIFAIDINYYLPDFNLVYALVAIGIIALVCIVASLYCIRLAFTLMPDSIHDGLETKGWADLTETHPRTLKAIKYNLVVLLCIHLPISRMAIQITLCRDDDEDIQSLLKLLKYSECPGMWTALGGFFLLLVGLGLPALIYYIISRNKPRGSPKHDGKVFDKDGITLIDFTDDIYNERITRDIEQQSSPFVDLYRGFERRWAYFKVLMMLLKLSLAGVIIAASGKLYIQTFGCAACLVIYTGFGAFSTPYIDHSYDKTELSGKLANIATLILGAVDAEFARICITGLMILQSLVLIYYTLMGFSCSKNKVKDLFGNFSFTDTHWNKEGRARDIIPGWEVELEVQHRIWWAFWDGILLNCYSEETTQRFLDLKRITENEGRAAIEEHFAAMSDAAAMEARKYALDELEGVDCYWDGCAFDGTLNSTSKLGKMYIKRYPFECVVVWDEGEDHCFLQGREKINALVAANKRPEIQAIRQVRFELRALVGCQCHWEFDRDETRRVEDGEETWKDKDGNEHKRTRYSNITVHMYYHNGTANIGANTDKRMAAGFNFSLTYHDGHGEGIAPHTQEKKVFQNETATVGSGTFGFSATFERTGNLEKFLNDPVNSGQAQQRLQHVHSDKAAYRQEMQKLDDENEALLPHSFWFKVYVKESLTRAEVEAYFRTCPGEIAKLPETHSKGLAYVFPRIEFALKSRQHATWYCFFDDLWNSNKNMSCMQDEAVQKLLDPKVSSSLCYTILSKQQLDEKLNSVGLRRPRRHFSDDLLDLLFEKLSNKIMSKPKGGATIFGYQMMTE